MYIDRRLMGLTSGVRWRILLAALLGLIAVAAGIARLAVAAVVLVKVISEGASFPSLTAPLIAMAGLIVLRSVLEYLRDIVSYHTASIIKIDLRKRLYTHALALGPGHFDQSRTGDAVLSIAEGVEQLEAFLGRYLPQLFVAALTPALVFIFMAILDLRTGLVFLAFAMLTLTVPYLFHRWNLRSSTARRKAYGTLGADFLDSVQGLATLKAFGQSRVRGQLLAEQARALYRRTMGVLAANSATGALTLLGISAGAAVALGWGAIRVSDGDLELRTLLIVLMLGVEVFRPMRELVYLYHEGVMAISAAQGIFAILDTPAEVIAPAQGDTGDEATSKSKQSPEVRFEGVSFAYSQGRRHALRDVSFTLQAGETLGLVGPSGAGKSTVVSLILRFFDPQSGRLLLGGRNIRELPFEVLRSYFAVVAQDTYLFHGTVADNLRFGKPEATQEELEEAARASNAHKFIVDLPQGYETVVGERAIRLSGGQKQRIAIARALLKDSPILILDEALSSVDAENEAVIQEALDRLMKGRTTLVIAHRLSSVVAADRILVLVDGHLVESGSHADLVARGGTYAELMAKQQMGGEHDQLDYSLTLPAATREPAKHLQVETPTSTGIQGPAKLSGNVSGRLGMATVWRRLLGLVRPWWEQLALTFVLGVSNHGSTVALGAVTALLVGQVITGGSLTVLLIMLGIFVPLAAVSAWAESWMSHDFAYRLLAEMRIDMYGKLDPLAPAYMVRRRSGDLVSIIGGDIETVEFFFAHTISPIFVAIVVPAGVLITLVVIAWPIALVAAPFLLAVAVSPFFAQKRSEWLGEEVRGRMGEIHSHMVDGLQGMREIAAFGRGADRTNEIVRDGWRFEHFQLRFLKERSFQLGFMEAMTALGGLAVLTIGAWLLTEGTITRPQLVLAAVLSMSAFAPISDIARTIKQLMETLAASRRVFAVHDEPVPVTDGPGVAWSRGGDAPTPPEIEFKGVFFSYGQGEPQALQNVSFILSPGYTVALVGRSGAGKTTCANLLMRFWDPGSGGISLDGHDLREFTLDTLRQQFAFVSQDTYLFNASIKENLRLGRPDASDHEIEEAARQANVHDFVTSFPDGYDTTVGERGMQLSGGQRQRIAIGRALLKNAPVLILDEATSHLDAVNEQQVRQALHRLMEGRTTLVIAHRLSTIHDADGIVVLESGLAVEQGNHRELLARQGLYAQLVSTQLVSSGASERPDSEPGTAHGTPWPGMGRDVHHRH